MTFFFLKAEVGKQRKRQNTNWYIVVYFIDLQWRSVKAFKEFIPTWINENKITILSFFAKLKKSVSKTYHVIKFSRNPKLLLLLSMSK